MKKKKSPKKKIIKKIKMINKKLKGGKNKSCLNNLKLLILF